MTPDSRGEPRSTSGRTMTPRAAFWCALSIWVLTLSAAATALIYNQVHPLPPKLSGGTGNAVAGTAAVAFIVGFRHRRRAARVETPGEPDRLAPVRHRPVVCVRHRRAAAAAIPRDPGLGHLVWLDIFSRHRVRSARPAALPDRFAALAPLAAGGVGRRLPPWWHGLSVTPSPPCLSPAAPRRQPRRRGRAGRARLRHPRRGQRAAARGDRPGRHRVAGVPLPAGLAPWSASS